MVSFHPMAEQPTCQYYGKEPYTSDEAHEEDRDDQEQWKSRQLQEASRQQNPQGGPQGVGVGTVRSVML